MIFEKQKQKQKSDSHRLILNTRMQILKLKSTNFMEKISKISKNNPIISLVNVELCQKNIIKLNPYLTLIISLKSMKNQQKKFGRLF